MLDYTRLLWSNCVQKLLEMGRLLVNLVIHQLEYHSGKNIQIIVTYNSSLFNHRYNFRFDVATQYAYIMIKYIVPPQDLLFQLFIAFLLFLSARVFFVVLKKKSLLAFVFPKEKLDQLPTEWRCSSPHIFIFAQL